MDWQNYNFPRFIHFNPPGADTLRNKMENRLPGLRFFEHEDIMVLTYYGDGRFEAILFDTTMMEKSFSRIPRVTCGLLNCQFKIEIELSHLLDYCFGIDIFAEFKPITNLWYHGDVLQIDDGNFISFGLLACAVPTFDKIVKINSVKWIKPEYRLALTMSSLFLVLYGMPFTHPGFIPVLTANGIILATQIAYLIIFLFYANNNKQRMYVGGVFLFELVVFSLVIGLVIRLGPTVETRETLDWCSAVACMPEALYMGMNFLGLIWGVLQLIVYDVYYRRYAKFGADKKLDTAEVQLQDKKVQV